jgi:hypothetical protein
MCRWGQPRVDRSGEEKAIEIGCDSWVVIKLHQLFARSLDCKSRRQQFDLVLTESSANGIDRSPIR